MQNSKSEAERWFRQSEHDLDDARYARDGKRWNLACFLTQQAAEKAIKAVIYNHGAEAAWGHSIAELCRDAAETDPDFESLRISASPLDKYYIPTRYPNGLPGGIPAEAFDEDDARRALELATHVIDFVRNRIAP